MRLKTQLIGLITFVQLLTCCILIGQGVGIGTVTPDSSAQLEVSATNKGVLIPRLTSAQRALINDPAVGLLVFDTDTESFWFKETAGWVNLVAHETDPQVSSLDGDKIPKWNGTALVDGIISDNGINVGIGTAIPYRLLHISTPADGETHGVRIGPGDQDPEGLELLYNNTGNTTSFIDSRWNNDMSKILFRTKTHGATLNAMTILGNGNVGIGVFPTGYPERNLHVAGNASQSVFIQSAGGDAKIELMSDNISFSSLYAPSGTGDLRFNHEGTGDVMAITEAGDVGIGTTAPNTKLHVKTGINGLTGRFESTTTGYSGINVKTGAGGTSFLLMDDGTNSATVEHWNNNLYFEVPDNTSRMTISGTTGNVGIGTLSPAAKLDVRAATSVLTVQSESSSSSDTPLLVRSSNGAIECLIVRANGNVGIGTVSPGKKLDVDGLARIKSHFIFNSSDGVINWGTADLYFRTNNTTGDETVYNDRMIIKNNGNVGIGTTSPLSKLDVQAATDVLKLQSVSSSSGDTPLLVRSNNGAIECMIIRANGNVGIGTTSPQSRLAVNGTITCKEVEVTLAGFPDYVFEDHYELMSLKDVEAFIERHGHLPNVPSAHEVEENGIGLGALNKILLEKVEELTLHLIEKEAQIERLQMEFNTQREEVMDRISRFENMIEKN